MSATDQSLAKKQKEENYKDRDRAEAGRGRLFYDRSTSRSDRTKES
jgi:hypothetical protein